MTLFERIDRVLQRDYGVLTIGNQSHHNHAVFLIPTVDAGHSGQRRKKFNFSNSRTGRYVE